MPSSRSPSRSPSASRSRSPSSSRSRSPTPNPEAEACPILIRIFVTKGHTPLADFDRGAFPFKDEYQVYGWKYSTPTSLIQQLYSVLPGPYRSPAAHYSFKHIYVDASERGLYRAKEIAAFTGRDFIATVKANAAEGGNGDVRMDRELDEAPVRRGRTVEEKTLDQCGFITGDLLSVSIHMPEPRGARSNGRDKDSAWGRGQPTRDVGRDIGRDTGSWRGGRGGGFAGRSGRIPSTEWNGTSRSRSPVRRESWSRRRD